MVDIFQIMNSRLNTCLLSIEENLKSFWNDRVLHQHYTDHGMNHSFRIKQILTKLLEEFPDALNEYEKFILLGAALLHDIGMQFPSYSKIELKAQYSLEELERIRKNHHLASFQIIKDSISPKTNFSLGLETCKDFINEIAIVSRNHRGIKLNTISKSSIAGMLIRRRLLSALLRLADELDSDFRRVNMDVLNMYNLPPLSKFHWWSHHYVESIMIDKGHIIVYFRFPVSFKQDQKWVSIFQQKTIESLRSTFLETYDILDENKIRLYREIKIGNTRFTSEGEVFDIPNDLRQFITEKIINSQEKIENASNRISMEFYLDGIPYSNEINAIQFLEKIAEKLDGEDYESAAVLIEKSKTEIHSAKDRLVLLQMAGVCYFNLGKYDLSEIYLKEILELSTKSNLRNIYNQIVTRVSSASNNNLGLMKLHKGEFTKALEFFEKSIEECNTIKNLDGKAIAIDNKGVVLQRLGLLDDALKCHFDANKIYKINKRKFGGAKSFGNIANVYLMQNNLDEAIKYSRKAMKLFTDLGNKSGEAEELQTIGIIHNQKRNFKEALKNFAQSYKLFNAIGFKRGILVTKHNIAGILLEEGRYESSLRILNKILLESQKIENMDQVVSVITSIGDVYYRKRNIRTALDYYERSLEMINYANYNVTKKIYFNISLLYAELNIIEKAQEFFELLLEKYPEDADICSNYALFLFSKLNNISDAEIYFEKAIKLDPKNQNNHLNYASMLLSVGKSEGISILQSTTFTSKDAELNKLLELEKSLYLFLHESQEDPNVDYLVNIKTLLEKGYISQGMDFSRNIEQAIRSGHKYKEILDILGEVISGEMSIDALETFEIWQKVETKI